jgi:Spy/CpxP family protein refolding chaperone
MKRAMLTVAMLSLTTMFVSAQDRPMQNAQGAEKFEQVAKQLNLTPAQEMQLMPILKAEAPKVQAIKDNASLTRAQKMEQLRALHQQTDPQVKSILTSEQYQTLKDMRRNELEQRIRNKQNQ